MFCVSEDAGPDQKSQRLKLLTLVSEGLNHSNPKEDSFSNLWFFDVNCLVHQFNLVVGGHLQLLDSTLKALHQDFNYYSALAKIVYCWRNHSQTMMAEYEVDQMGAQHLPPAPCAARWGCVHEIECFLLANGPETVTKNFLKACARISAKRSTNQDSVRKSTAVDEIQLDEMKAFQQRMTKYMSSATSTISNPVFWFLLHVSFVTKEPLISCFGWLQKYRQAAIIEFTTSKCNEFAEQLRQLVIDQSWIDWCLDESGARNLSREIVLDLTLAAVHIAVHNYTAFERRIVEYITKCLGLA